MKTRNLFKCLFVLSACLSFTVAGCFRTGSKEKKYTPPTEALRFFADQAGTSSKQEVTQAYWQIIDDVMEAYTDQPVLISKISAGIAGIANRDERGYVASFSYTPFYDTTYRLIFPSEDARSLFWNDEKIISEDISDSWQEIMTYNLETGSFTINKNAKVYRENEVELAEKEWFGSVLTDGVYPKRRRWNEIGFWSNPAVFMANPTFFTFSVEPVFETADEEDVQSEQVIQGWRLTVKLSEEQGYSRSWYGSFLGFYRSLGQLQSGESVTWDRFDYNKQEMVLNFDSHGILRSSNMVMEVDFSSHTQDGNVIKNREILKTLWIIAPYPSGQKWEDVIEQMESQEVPALFIEDMNL